PRSRLSEPRVKSQLTDTLEVFAGHLDESVPDRETGGSGPVRKRSDVLHGGILRGATRRHVDRGPPVSPGERRPYHQSQPPPAAHSGATVRRSSASSGLERFTAPCRIAAAAGRDSVRLYRPVERTVNRASSQEVKVVGRDGSR